MRLLIDANLSPSIATALDDIGHDATHVNDHGLVTASDKQIAEFAAASGMTVVSADSDFAMNLAMTGDRAPSLILLRSADAMTPAQQAEVLAANLPNVEPDVDQGAVASIARGKVRVRRLPLR